VIEQLVAVALRRRRCPLRWLRRCASCSHLAGPEH